MNVYERTRSPVEHNLKEKTMSYVQAALLPGEQIAYRARVHWLVFLPGLFYVLLGWPFLELDSSTAGTAMVGKLIIAWGLFQLVRAAIHWYSTELAITSKRVIVKTGLIRRDTVELLHSKVESVSVKQGIIDRMFGAGTVLIGGTGGVRTPVAGVDQPLVFRSHALQRVDAATQ